ncbi:MAG: hypothetical protein AMXMBFR7_10630 [Planctomycetota bacterium]
MDAEEAVKALCHLRRRGGITEDGFILALIANASEYFPADIWRSIKDDDKAEVKRHVFSIRNGASVFGGIDRKAVLEGVKAFVDFFEKDPAAVLRKNSSRGGSGDEGTVDKK